MDEQSPEADMPILLRPAEKSRYLTEEESLLLDQRLLQVGRRLRDQYSRVPFYAERAKNNPYYWTDWAASRINDL